jgi:hypothetical protein
VSSAERASGGELRDAGVWWWTHGLRRKYASANFLSWETLSMLKEMRQQFEQLLRGIGFVPKGGGTSHQGSWNLNAANVPVIKAVLCAGLYGNVAVMDPSSGGLLLTANVG